MKRLLFEIADAAYIPKALYTDIRWETEGALKELEFASCQRNSALQRNLKGQK